MTVMGRKRCVILDRDGTVIEDKDYLADPDGVELCPQAGEGLRAIAAMGLGLVIVTNQSGIARGYFSEEDLQAIHRRMSDVLFSCGVRLDGLYYCPHGPDEGCSCRKPAPAMVKRAAEELGFDPARSFVIGDKASDIQLGHNVGATTILVRTGNGRRTEMENAATPDHVADNLLKASSIIRQCLEKEPLALEPDS
jgi:D-glycero-D-manno-heptose 1,7-bisphosphate phosphatase